ncbi:ornithine carbamoyltransferase, mitochondrial-like isoform X2 [Trichoplusia ni]|uniref:ornithine carbamoyltransferase n=1 Tax=Trichoplusia ni TaxID=7111 RepID=A0A7E5VNT5_TRINI|nr:ornithine carbamoyltransferase, mitochondrial-like isoform X2 [Trichoplusia ni]
MFGPKDKDTKHLICFKQWNPKMVNDILASAINLKTMYGDTHNKRMPILPYTKVMLLQEVNEPILNLAVSKATSFLGAVEVNITDGLIWDKDYHGKIFSEMADVIFAFTKTHACIKRFAGRSTVPVICAISRTHASLQALSTIMSIMEEFGSIKGLNLAYVGAPHPVLNSYLLLCPMLGANIKFKCCCPNCPVSPLLLHASKEMTAKTATQSIQCLKRKQALHKACIVISGPTPPNKDKIKEFTLTVEDISKCTDFRWIFYHTCPRAEEVDDELFWGTHSRTFNAFVNMQYIAAALMAKAVRDLTFC